MARCLAGKARCVPRALIVSLDTIKPPFSITPRILALCGEIERLVGRAEGIEHRAVQPMLRKRNRVRTVRGSVAIEGNRLSDEQVTALIDGKRVVGDRRELIEVTNANEAYERAARFDAGSERDLLAAHRVLTKGLVDKPGKYRTGAVAVLAGSRVAHLAPPAHLVTNQVRALLLWLRERTVPPLVRSCVAHYELLFFHPFIDGNGRLARLWQHLVLLEASPVFAFVPVESVIRDRQRRYYAVLQRCDRTGNCTGFIELVLEALRDALRETVELFRPERATPGQRLELAREHFGRRWFSRGQYLRFHQTISTATASRDLLQAKQLTKRGARRFTEYRFG